jgi:hypothetical protein
MNVETYLVSSSEILGAPVDMQSVRNIVVVGYYNHNNIGDEQYKISLKQFLHNKYPKALIEFIDCDTIVNYTFPENHLIVIGGGDIITGYFINKIYNKFKDTKNTIIAMCVGVPFVGELLDLHEKLSIITHFYVRSRQDIERLRYVFPGRVSYLPDSSCLMTTDELENHRSRIYKHLLRITKKLVFVCLNGEDTYGPGGADAFAGSLNSLIERDYHVVFITFDREKNGDDKIHNQIINKLKPEYVQDEYAVTFIDSTNSATAQEIFSLFRLAYFAICSKFHACLFATYNYVPFVPLYNTRKIKNFLADINYDSQLNFKNMSDAVTNLDTMVTYVEENREIVSRKLQKYSQESIEITLMKKLTYIATREPSSIIKKLYDAKDALVKFIDENRNDYSFDDLKVMSAKIVSCIIINCVNSPYVYGLGEKIVIQGSDLFGASTVIVNSKYDYFNEWLWIIKDYMFNDNNNDAILKDNPQGLFNLAYIDQFDNTGAHRSGWQYVYSNIKYLNNSNKIMLDMYVDRTFHWEEPIYAYAGIVPYKKPWMGVIHHTFEQSFGEYNNHKLFENPLFLESLKTCKGLIVLSNYLKKQIQAQPIIKDLNVQVFSLVHPTETNVECFTLDKFNKNMDKKIINIGGWLRNIWMFYKCKVPGTLVSSNWFCKNAWNIRSTWHIKKCAIKGYAMNNYFPNHDFLEDLREFLSGACLEDRHGGHCSHGGNCSRCDKNCSNGGKNCSDNKNCSTPKNCSDNKNCSMSEFDNIWNKFFYRDVCRLVNSVEIIERVTNEDYDKLLTENIVFLNLVDASAVNTLIECIVRNVPIVVNKIEPVVELLGPDYPLYYEVCERSFELDLTELLSHKNIKRAYAYISKLDKRNYHIETFIQKLTAIMQSVEQ